MCNFCKAFILQLQAGPFDRLPGLGVILRAEVRLGLELQSLARWVIFPRHYDLESYPD